MIYPLDSIIQPLAPALLLIVVLIAISFTNNYYITLELGGK